MKAWIALLAVVALIGAAVIVGYRTGWIGPPPRPDRRLESISTPPTGVSAAKPSTVPAVTGPAVAASAQTGAALGGNPATAANVPASANTPAATTRAIELRVTNVQIAPLLDGRQAPAGQTFVVLDTSWKNVIPLTRVEHKKRDSSFGAGGLGTGGGSVGAPADEPPATMEPTPYVVADVPLHLWLLSDTRYAFPIDTAATSQAAGHLPTDTFRIAKLNDVLTGSVVFDAPADARYLALLYLDTAYGNALVPLKGQPSDAPQPKTIGPPVSNDLVELAVTGVSATANASSPPAGFKYVSVGLRGTSRSGANIVQLKMSDYAFLETEQAFIAQPDPAPSLARSFATTATFLPGAYNEGQLAFLVPADAQRTLLLLRPPQGGPIDLPAPDQVKPSWPTPIATIADGTTMRVNVLPGAPLPANLPPSDAGKQYVLVDLVAENLKPAQGIELQTDQQFRLMDSAGTLYPPAPQTSQLVFHPTGNSVVPANAARRIQLLYLVPTGQPVKLQYRGFEKTDTVDLRLP